MHDFHVGRAFRPYSAYQPGAYEPLPFRFTKLNDDRYVATNIVGEYLTLDRNTISEVAYGTIDSTHLKFHDLLSRHFLAEKNSQAHVDFLAAKFRTKRSFAAEFTSLHMFVVTLRCDNSCSYCQVSRVSEDRSAFDMTQETALKAVDLVFRSPSHFLKIEFQGGEPLLNFPLIRFIVEAVEARKAGRNIQYVIATNLANITVEILEFAKRYQINFSTSLDGPEALHNGNRPRPGNDSHQKALEGIRMVREAMGHDSVSALMTTTLESLGQPEKIIDEYVRLGFRDIFLRHISPYGFAVRSAKRIGYETDLFIDFYKRGLAYLVELNTKGIDIRETFTSIMLRRILTPYADGYVNLQSPDGMGIMAIAYNYDGNVYSSDEGRMLAEMGDTTFKMGNVHADTYEDMFLKNDLLGILHETMTEAIPGCTDCAFQPWCGTDPTYHHTTQGSFAGHRPTSGFCKRQMAIFRHLITLLEDDKEAAQVLKRWAKQ